jgi:hypothetical protein
MSISPEEARGSLAAAGSARRAVADEVGTPAWYWWGLGISWVVIGVLADLDVWWLTGAVTLVFGALHAAVFRYATSGRHRTSQVSVRRELAGSRTPLLVWLLLVGLVVVGAAFALLLAADGARHAASIASVLPATIVVLGGPRLVAWNARRASSA